MPPSSVGPAGPAEAAILWQDARTAFDEARYSDAAFGLQRIVDRHSGSEHYLEAELMLGLALMRSHREAESIAPLKRYVLSMGAKADGYRARLALGRAYLATTKFHEALLSAIEILDAAAAGRVPQDLYYEALLLKAKAHLALAENPKASRTLGSADTAWTKLPADERATLQGLRGEQLWSGLELKLRECAALAPRARAKEADVMASAEKRGICLGEAVLGFRDVVSTRDPHWSQESLHSLGEGYRKFWSDCLAPPAPPGKRDAEQARRYKAELVDLLRQRCTERIEKGLALLGDSPGGEYGQSLQKQVRGLYGNPN